MNPRRLAPLALLALLLGGTACSSAEQEATPPDPSSVVSTALPGLATPSGEPTLAAMATTSPRPGQVAQVAGPFSDRVQLEGLRLDGDTLTGRVRVTSDVSDLLELQVLAGFHDASGALLGTARFTHHLVEDGHHEPSGTPTPGATPDETLSFSITAPAAARGRVASASVGIPVLVNE